MADEANTEVVEETTAADTTAANDTQTQTETTETTTETQASTETKTEEAAGDKDAAASKLPDDWRELAANGDEDALKLLKRYGSLNGVVKALKDSQNLIRSGKLKRDMPDPKDEKAMAEWRKAEGIPDDPTGYTLPDTVVKRLGDDDKPLLSNFTEFAHSKGANQKVVEIATEWYAELKETQAAQQLEFDAQATESAEDALRSEWAGGEYRANLTLGHRFMEQIPGVGKDWMEARMPDGRRLGDVAEVVKWASDMGREQFGDVAFASSDSAARHEGRKAELEKLMSEDIDKYYESGGSKEYAEILEREQKRARK